ncbi:MAG: multidrug efflux SMR transporter [Selenomonas sp.]|nr:multidrug efflux SMR transporter [Selenomonas sp.]
MQWVYLLIAGFFEITWAVALKLSRGFSLGLPSVVTLVGMVFSYVFLGMAMRNLPLGVAYAVWTGIGIMGSFVFGVCVLHESASNGQWICVGLIVLGIAGLKLFSH